MSVEVRAYLENSGGNKFTETAPRPPVPGEENELQSNGSSHKSKSSNRSLKSNGNHSPSGTPRRSNLDKGSRLHADGKMVINREEAPLGFEPEGSASGSPQFTEHGTPPYERWAKNFQFLIEDADGIKLFRAFLEQEQALLPSTLDFYFACQGLKKLKPNESDKIKNLAKAIYKRFIRQEKVHINPDIKKALSEKVSNKAFDQCIFDIAQNEVEKLMREETYPLFIKSDLYVQYVQNGGDSPKSSASSSGANSVRPMSINGPMPTVHEDKELETEELDASTTGSGQGNCSLTSRAIYATRYHRISEARRPETVVSGSYLNTASAVPHPYHISYCPASAQDSEIASLSSDALTDDTRSLTDSSVDGVAPYGYNSHRQRRLLRQMQRKAQQNPDSLKYHSFIPRTAEARMPKDRNLAETNQRAFADLLISKLKVVKEQQEKELLFREKLTFISEGDDSISEDNVAKPATLTAHETSSSSAFSAFIQTMSAMTGPDPAEDSAQSILEEHCSRVWERSAQETPSRSPGKTSPPRAKSPGVVAGRRPAPPPPQSTTSGGSGSNKHAKVKREDAASLVSYDSGMSSLSTDKNSSKVIHHHHHHHHVVRERELREPPSRSKQHIEKEAQKYSMQVYDIDGSGSSYETGRPRVPAKKPSGRKTSDAASNIDSGVSVACDQDSNVPIVHQPNNEKVMAWMLENEKIVHGASTNTDSERSSSHKRSHKSSSMTGSPMQHRHSAPKGGSGPGNGKQPVQYNVTRSGSLELSGLSTVMSSMTTSQGMPFQPFSQDPNMPLLEPPNPTTQLEEAKRRLEDERMKAYKNSPANKSYTTLPKQHSQQTMSLHGGSVRGLSSNAHSDIEETYSKKKSAFAAPPPSTSSSATTSYAAPSKMTVVGYYFCGEPVPYRTKIQGKKISLGQFKQILTKKGNYKYFFKKTSNEFGTVGEVFEELTCDQEILPLWEGKIVGKVEKCE